LHWKPERCRDGKTFTHKCMHTHRPKHTNSETPPIFYIFSLSFCLSLLPSPPSLSHTLTLLSPSPPSLSLSLARSLSQMLASPQLEVKSCELCLCIWFSSEC